MEQEHTKALNELSHRVIGAAIEVYRHLGPGFLESVYEEALCYELMLRSIPYERQFNVAVQYKNHVVGAGRLDLLIDRCLVVELKAIELILPIHIAQTMSYLKTTGYTLALLINFNVTALRNGIKRVILS